MLEDRKGETMMNERTKQRQTLVAVVLTFCVFSLGQSNISARRISVCAISAKQLRECQRQAK